MQFKSRMKKQVKPYHGIMIFGIVMIFLLLVAVPIQRAWGMYGVAITELLLLIIALVSVKIFNIDFKEVLPIRAPKFKELLGVLVLWIASYLTVLIITLLTQYLFPQFYQVSSSLQETLTSVPMVISLLIIALMPAICEEVLHRGFILTCFSGIRNKRIIILLMGLIFGIFHLDIYRFLPTALLGIVLTYIMLRTKNIIIPIIFHFINNFFTTWLSFYTQSKMGLDSNPNISLDIIGVFLIIGAIIPFLFLFGSRLIHTKVQDNNSSEILTKKNTESFSSLKITISVTIMMILCGIVLFGLNQNKLIFETNLSCGVNCKSEDIYIPMEVKEEGIYTIEMMMKNERGISDFKIVNQEDEEIINFHAKEITLTNPELKLYKGEYLVIVEFHLDDIESYYVNFNDEQLKEWGLKEDLNTYSDFELKINIKKN